MATDRFAHLGLSRWPFTVVPDIKYCTFLAARPQVESDISDLLRNLSRRETSSIHIFWAWFGAGKTHTLFYLSNRANDLANEGVDTMFSVVYSEFPKGVRGFIDIYRSFVRQLDTDSLTEAFFEVSTASNSAELLKDLKHASIDLYTALYVLATGEKRHQIIATRWLLAETLPVSELRNIGVSQRISSAEDSSRILSALISMLFSAAKVKGYLNGRVLWILDEFQRIEITGSKTTDEINTCLHSIFNSCSNGLSLFLSFSGAPRKTLPSWFSRELKDRIGITKVVVLPPMSTDEALVFVQDVLTHARPEGFTSSSLYYPFSESACKTLISEIKNVSDIKPRAIMKAFHEVLEEADVKIEKREMEIISSEFVKKVLQERLILIENTET